MNKKLLIAAVATGTIIVGGFTVATTSFAAEESNVPMRPIMSRFAQKLGVSTEDAEKAWEETHREMAGERLDRAVEDGMISEEQKQEILEKQAELKSKLEELKSQREIDHEAIHELMESTKDWAEEEDIPAGMLKGGIRGGSGHRLKGGMRGAKMGLHGDGECLR